MVCTPRRLTCALLGLLALHPACAPREVSLGTISSDAGGDAGAEVGAPASWIAIVPGEGDQAVSAVAFGPDDQIIVAGQQPGTDPDEASTDVFVAAFARTNGTARWRMPVPGRDFGWDDEVATMFSADASSVSVAGTYRTESQDSIGFIDSVSSTGAVTKSSTPLNPSCVAGIPCDPTLTHRLLTARPAADDLAVGGILWTVESAPLPWFNGPVPSDSNGWGFVGVVRNGLPLWARSQGDRFIRSVSSVTWLPDGLLVAASGSDSAVSDDADRPPWLWLLKFNSAGEMVLARSFRSSEGVVHPRLALTSAGPVVVGGFAGRFAIDGLPALITSRPQDTFVLALNPDLSPRWLQSLGGNDLVEGGHDVLATAAGDVIVACGACAVVDADEDQGVPGLVRLGVDGQRKALQRWSSTGVVQVRAMAAQGNDLLIGGSFTNQLTIGVGQQATATDGQDGFVLRVPQP
ncbi:MAG: hypothetical protein SF187_12400 [Deltaproteobacteria bacterium]|nr:hypothetical protein [Deltaproteobacteria bacterium]